MNYTKNAIMDAFWQLLEDKPYNKITVKDIVDRCQINRNTFYYHFHDIPDLLETILKKDTDYLICTYGSLDSPMDCLTPLVERCIEHKKVFLHIYRSIQREVFLNELDRIALYVVTQYINTYTKDIPLPPDDKAIFIRFYKCTLTGVILDWLDNGMEYDPLKATARILDLFGDAGRRAFLKSSELARS